MNGELHPETLAIRGAKEQTGYNDTLLAMD